MNKKPSPAPTANQKKKDKLAEALRRNIKRRKESGKSSQEKTE